MEDPYRNLANAIIIRAVKDYRKANRQLVRSIYHEHAQFTKKECEKFFRSNWFRDLTDIEPDYLMRLLSRSKV